MVAKRKLCKNSWVSINGQRWKMNVGRAPFCGLSLPAGRGLGLSRLAELRGSGKAVPRQVWPQGCVLLRKPWVSLELLFSHCGCCLQLIEMRTCWAHSTEEGSCLRRFKARILLVRLLPPSWVSWLKFCPEFGAQLPFLKLHCDVSPLSALREGVSNVLPCIANFPL